MPGEVKMLNITGVAADDYQKVRGTTRKRGRRPTVPSGATQLGGDAPPGASLAGAANYNAARRISNSLKVMPMKGGAAETLPGSNPPNPANLAAMPAVAANLKVGAMPPTQEVKPTPLPPITPPLTTPAAAPQAGGKRLELAPPKKKTKSAVLLAPPAAAKKHRKGVHQTRKIRVQLAGLKTRLTRAKTIHKDSREKSIAEVRKVLEEAKLVKPAKEGKQVPESVLRDIYKDYLLLRNKAL
jgi:hypothetical protein